MRKLLPLLLLLLLGSAAHATDYYVDGKYGNDGNCRYYDDGHGHKNNPLRNFNCAMNRVAPGDTVHLVPSMVYTHIYINKHGAPGRPITIVGDGDGSDMTQIINGTTQNSKQSAIYIAEASYVDIRNLDASTPHWAEELSGAEAVFIVRSHHIGVYHSRLHDSGGGGVQTSHSDWLTISENTVYNNAWDATGGAFGSGISILGSTDTDGNRSDYKIRITQNLIYGNHNTPRRPEDKRNFRGSKCQGDQCNTWGMTTDGNGIILDRNNDTGYHGRMLIANNVIFGNGGRGIHLYLTDNVTISENTVYLNCRDVYDVVSHEGEVEVHLAGNVNVFNNILYADGVVTPFHYRGKRYNFWPHTALSIVNQSDSGPVYANNNILFTKNRNPKRAIYIERRYGSLHLGSDNHWADPKFVHASTYPSEADLKLRRNSPARNSGSSDYNQKTDFFGRDRSPNHPDIGAYEQ